MAGNFVLVGPTAKVVTCRFADLAAVVIANGAVAIAAAGGLILGVRDGQGNEAIDTPDSTDTNDTPYKAAAVGNYDMRWSLRTYRQTASLGGLANGPPHALSGGANNAAMNIVPKTNLGLLIYPAGFVGAAGTITIVGANVTALAATNAYIIPYFVVSDFRPGLRVEGSQPQEFDIEGRSSGIFANPTLV